ncbi:glycosyltransferase family 2 protein [Pedobacter sp. AW31-3R]|uniref:glycosyltransferase family 2 protein n=1 Tax=Pedobacter sp. AW31-3R TaxID=3445781 RepID=UPI003F9FBE1E
MKLLVITPFKNEQGSIAMNIESVIKQGIHPVKWIMMDDCSDDESPAIVKEYQERYPFIHYHRREKTGGARATGNNVVDAFNEGLQVADSLGVEWDIVSKFDADIIIQRSDYYKFILGKFASFPLLGIASGVTYIEKEGVKVIESKHKWHTQGPTKFYRKECLLAIGGLRPFKGWDGIDNMLARSNGYITEKFFEQEVLHLYPTQTRTTEGGFAQGLRREAKGYRNIGYPMYMCIFRSLRLAKDKGLYHSWLFFYYSVIALLSQKPMITADEVKIVKAFMRKRWKNDFVYTGSVS